MGGDVVVRKTHDNKQYGQNGETAQLNGLASNRINSGDRHPVAWYRTSKNNNDVTDGGVVQVLVHVVGVLGRVTNDAKNGRIVQ